MRNEFSLKTIVLLFCLSICLFSQTSDSAQKGHPFSGNWKGRFAFISTNDDAPDTVCDFWYEIQLNPSESGRSPLMMEGLSAQCEKYFSPFRHLISELSVENSQILNIEGKVIGELSASSLIISSQNLNVNLQMRSAVTAFLIVDGIWIKPPGEDRSFRYYGKGLLNRLD